MNILITVCFLAFPALLVWLCNKVKALDKIGIVLLCYVSGMVIGNIPGLLPESFTTSASGGDSVLSLLQSITICVALPLVLFSLDLKKWFRIAKKGMLCMLLACVAIIIVAFAINIFAHANTNSPQYAAAAVAVYSGGTVNLGSISTAIGMSNNDYVVFNTYDAIISVIYVLFLSTVGRVFFQKVFRLRAFEHAAPSGDAGGSQDTINESVGAYASLLKPKNMPGLLAAFGISVGIFGVSYALNMLASKVDKGLGMTVMMLAITSIGIGMSFIKRVREIKYTFQLGMYIIYVFCFSVAASADLKALINFDLTIFLYVGVSIIGSLLLHALMCKAAKIDSDTMIITSVSAVCSPPFVPAVAASLKNKDILISGLATGVVGYAVGNYLGIAMYYFINWFNTKVF